jgi:hypothetical protein
MNGVRVIAAIAAITLLAAGCGSKKEPTLEPTVDARDSAPAGDGDAAPRARQLRAELPQFQAAVAPLPGRNEQENRKQVARAFEAAGSVLSILEGPRPAGAFRQQLRIIDTTRQRLASGSQSLAIEPTVNAGLRAVYNALVGIRQDQFGNDADVAARLDALRSRVDDLDTVRGPLHRLVVAQVFRGAGDVVDAMAKSLETRSGNEQAPPAEPAATAPAAAQ